MEEAQARVQRELTAMFTELDKTLIRKLQGDMYRCSAECCNDTTLSTEENQRCIERCSQGLSKIQNFVQNEVESYQNRLQRCAMDCQDRAKDKIKANMSDTEQRQLQKEVEQCAIQCMEKHIKLLPGMSNRIKDFANSCR